MTSRRKLLAVGLAGAALVASVAATSLTIASMVTAGKEWNSPPGKAPTAQIQAGRQWNDPPSNVSSGHILAGKEWNRSPVEAAGS